MKLWPMQEDQEHLENLFAQGALDKAYGVALRLVKKLPDNAIIHGICSEILLRRGEWKESIFHACEALRLNPELGYHYRVIIATAEQQLGNMLSHPDNEGLLWHGNRQLSRYPDRESDYADLTALIKNHYLPDKLPGIKPFQRTSKLLTLGSWFAMELRLRLQTFDQCSNGFWVPEGLNNTAALLAFIEWCILGSPSAGAYRYDDASEGPAMPWTPEGEQKEYNKRFQDADGYLITVGTAGIWEDQETGDIFWRGVPKHIHESGRYRCRLSTVEENEHNLNRIIALLKQAGGSKPIIFTLSPLPLKASNQKTSCVIADCVSKSTLRVALHHAVAGSDENVFYWPSFEMVKSLGCHLPRPTFGDQAMDQRHISLFAAPLIIDAFVDAFFNV